MPDGQANPGTPAASRESEALHELRDAHARLLLAVESGDIGTFDLAPLSGTMQCSERWRGIHGLAPNAPISFDAFVDRVDPDDRARVQSLVARALDPGGSGHFDLEYRVLGRDGTSGSVVAKARAFFEGAGRDRRAVRLVGTVIDVTERRRAESYARLLAEASTLLASSLDTEVMLAGVARLAVQSFATFVAFDMLDDSGAVVRAVAVQRDGSKSEQLQRAMDVVPDPGSQLAVPLVARGRVLGAVTFVSSLPQAPFENDERDVAEQLASRTATAIDNAQLYRAAVAANDAKSTFIAAMSHELRTPLTAIMGYEELLADGITGPVTEPQRQQLGRIKASATHLLALIDEILTFARVEAGSEHAQMEVVEIRTVLEDAASLVAPLAGDRGLALTVELPDGAPRIRTDAQKVRQILVSLLSNATKFTEQGGITLSARRAQRQVDFCVCDTGIGILPQHLQQIFEPFWQVDQRANRRVGGTGLGLTVSRRLAQLIGGDLRVESRVGGGSTFTLQLPAID